MLPKGIYQLSPAPLTTFEILTRSDRPSRIPAHAALAQKSALIAINVNTPVWLIDTSLAASVDVTEASKTFENERVEPRTIKLRRTTTGLASGSLRLRCPLGPRNRFLANEIRSRLKLASDAPVEVAAC